jgi:cysteine desulfurase family protein
MAPPVCIYLDHAATSWPKPPSVMEAMRRVMEDCGANPGRSAHRMSLEAARVVHGAREAVAGWFGVADPANVVFTSNGTHALNLAILGLLKPGDRVITTALEHNSVMRPLHAVGAVAIERLPCDGDGYPAVDALEERIRVRPPRLVVATHGSNVNGRLQPIREMGAICRRHGVLFLVDAAQTAGCVPIHVGDDHVDLLAFSGHKALCGPQGTGCLCVNTQVLPRPLLHGGTGSLSESEEHPGFMPDRLEAGTLNGPGIAGLRAGLEWVERVSLEEIRRRHERLRNRLVDGLRAIPGVRVFAGELPVVSFTVRGMSPDRVALRLDRDHGIYTRVGLHCAPGAHRALGTAPSGTVRMSMGYGNTLDEMDTAIGAVAAMARAS